MRIKRRTFLKTAGLGAVSILSGLKTAFTRNEEKPAAMPSARQARWVPSVCLQCPGGCGILVRVVDGRAVKVEGNPLYPINRGKVCPKANAGLQVLYDPDRIKGPLRRAGERGAGQWEPISWDEAIQEVVNRLQKLRQDGEPHSLVFLTGRLRGQMGDLIDRFCQACGSPNHIKHDSLCISGELIANYLTQGRAELSAYDWENCNYVLSFGRSFLEASRPTVRQIMAFGYMRRDRPNLRTRFVQVETRLSVTGAKADEWVPILPGTDGALALGIANYIIKEELYDRDFVEKYAFGFDDWTDDEGQEHMGFRSLVLRDYPLDRVEEITGVPVETIAHVAHEFATTPPAVASGGRGSSTHSNGVFSHMAIQSLNALVGSIERPGGVLAQREPPLTPWPEVTLDDIAGQGLAMPRIDHAGTRRYPLAESVYQTLPESVLQEGPYQVKAVFLYYTNPLFSAPEVGRFYQAFQKVPFIVSFSPFMDDSSLYADLILPDHTYLERLQDDVIDPSLGYPVVGLRQPVVEQLYDTRNTGDVLLQIVQKLGGSVAESFPWRTFEELLQYRLAGLWRVARGSIRTSDFAHFWEELRTQSVWHDPPYIFGQWSRVFPTPSGQFEFYSHNLKRQLEEIAIREAEEKDSAVEEELESMLTELEIVAREDELYMPHYEAASYVGEAEEYPFYLNTYKLMTHAEGRGANAPWLQEMLGLTVSMKWDDWVEINPKVAEQLGIQDKDWVWVESPLGERLKTRAKLWPGTRLDVVNMPFELGHKGYGRWADGRGGNPNRLIANSTSGLSGTVNWFATRVKVYKA